MPQTCQPDTASRLWAPKGDIRKGNFQGKPNPSTPAGKTEPLDPTTPPPKHPWNHHWLTAGLNIIGVVCMVLSTGRDLKAAAQDSQPKDMPWHEVHMS